MAEYSRKETEIAEAVQALVRPAIAQAKAVGVRRLKEEMNFSDAEAARDVVIMIKQVVGP